MRRKAWIIASFLSGAALLATPVRVVGEDLSKVVAKAIERSTLDQAGTHPFHLKATYAPSFERDNNSHRTGVVEIWWQSPTQWRRELRSPEFHQITIVDGARQWQKNDGDYFPDWLRQLAEAIVRPVPFPTDALLGRVESAEIRHLMGQTNINWDAENGPGDAQSHGKGYIALMDKTGLINYTGGLGFGGSYHEFADFHGRTIARTVSSGYVEVTAKIAVLEDLNPVPAGFFDANTAGGDAQLIETAILDEGELRRNLQPGAPVVWPTLENGPFEGVVWTEVVLDRTGKIREMIPPISDNPGLKDAAEQVFRGMRFNPFLLNGQPVQATGRLSLVFKTSRLAGTETFDSAHNYFERGRKVNCIGSGATAPYKLRAEFQAGTKDGVKTGRYEDTWISETQWRREAWFGSSHLARTQNGEKYYVVSDGPDIGLLKFMMMAVEPIPATDTMTESDWRIRHDTLDGAKSIRVFRGPEGPNGELEPGKSQGYWFDESGQLLKSYTMGFEIRPLAVQAYGGVQMPRRIDISKDGKTGMRLIVKEIGPPDSTDVKEFVLKGHEWQRAFTSEVR